MPLLPVPEAGANCGNSSSETPKFLLSKIELAELESDDVSQSLPLTHIRNSFIDFFKGESLCNQFV